MVTQNYFKNEFCQAVIEAYGKEKFTSARIQSAWNSLKHLSDDVLKQGIPEIIKPITFPGVEKMVEICSRFQNEVIKHQMREMKATNDCVGCSGQGVRVVNNFAYRCICKLGDLLYPAFPKYAGQVPFKEIITQDAEGNTCKETYSHIYITHPTSREVKDCRFVLKDIGYAAPSKQTPVNKPKLVEANEFHMDRF